jgi:hypothetical protein
MGGHVHTLTLGPLAARDRVVVIVGTVAALALGGCSSSTAPAPPTASVALWVANTGNTILGYTAAQLASSTSAVPAVVLTTCGQCDGAAFAFDTRGNFWVVEDGTAMVVEYTASQLAVSGSPTPTVTLTANGTPLFFLTFDAGGDLWVGNASTLVEFTASQLAASGSPTPAVTLSFNAGSFDLPPGLAFDHSGNLWATSGNAVVEFSASQLASSGSPVPTVTLSDNGRGSLNRPGALAFDGGGNLWVVGSNGFAVVEFARSQLGSTGSPTPAVTLTSTSFLQGLAFDGHGNLWVSRDGPDAVLEFAASQLMASGAPTPTVTISGASLIAPEGLAFTP